GVVRTNPATMRAVAKTAHHTVSVASFAVLSSKAIDATRDASAEVATNASASATPPAAMRTIAAAAPARPDAARVTKNTATSPSVARNPGCVRGAAFRADHSWGGQAVIAA